MRSMIIHLPTSTARRPNAEDLLRTLPEASIIDAVDGRDAAQIGGVRCHPGTLYRPHYPFALKPAEIGLFLSYRRAWAALVDSMDEYALIVEDDLAVDRVQLDQALAMIAEHATPDMFIRLPVKQRERPLRVLAQEGEMQFFVPRVIGLQTVAQVVGRNAAARLLRNTLEIDRPIDTTLQMHWATGQAIHTIAPNGNREIAANLGGSTIQTSGTRKGLLKREFARARYRAQISLRPQK